MADISPAGSVQLAGAVREHVCEAIAAAERTARVLCCASCSPITAVTGIFSICAARMSFGMRSPVQDQRTYKSNTEGMHCVNMHDALCMYQLNDATSTRRPAEGVSVATESRTHAVPTITFRASLAFSAALLYFVCFLFQIPHRT